HLSPHPRQHRTLPERVTGARYRGTDPAVAEERLRARHACPPAAGRPPAQPERGRSDETIDGSGPTRVVRDAAEVTAGTLALHLARVVNAPREVVFRMHPEPEQLARWFGPEGFTVSSVDADVRIGGTYRLEMQPPEGDAFFLGGEFLDIEPPQRLSYTFR